MTYDEFEKCINDFGAQIDQQDIRNLFKSIDTDKTGEISFDEFLRVVVGEMNAFRKNLVQRAFNMLDQDKNGAIEMVEFS